MALEGDGRGRQMLQAVIDDPDLPAIFAIQPKAEQARYEELPGMSRSSGGHEPFDLDAVIRELLSRPHPAPLPR